MATLELIAVGDVSLICPQRCDPFEHVARYLRAGDIVFGNLEGVLCRTGVAAEKETTLRTSPRRAGYLRQTGFSILNVANNHALDFGPTGLRQTLAALREQGIRFVGVNDASLWRGCEVIECKGLRMGFLAYCETDASGRREGLFINPIERDTILEHLRGLRTRCDIAVVSLHWGFEYVYYPSPEQIQLAHDLIAGGAALVLGHHPHVVQGIEEFRGGLIVYSLGGFQFESSEEGMQRSFMLRAKISKRGVERYRLVPIRIGEDSRPRLARAGDRRDMLRRVEEISAPVREGRVTEKWWFERMAGVYLSANVRAWRTRVRTFGIRHFLQFARWLVSGFTIKCYLGLLRRRVGLYE
jgi:poly-gamma-glutamate capsule biosynthesis protein CapA/YwtB (metallophosphatase superfamily)